MAQQVWRPALSARPLDSSGGRLNSGRVGPGVVSLVVTEAAHRSGSSPPATRPPALHLHLLSSFELRTDDGPVDLPSTAQRLLAVLALHSRPLQRSYVAGTLWPDVPDAKAGASLRSALWRTRQPGVEAIDATSTHLSLAAGVEADIPAMFGVAQRLGCPDRGGPFADAPALAAGFRDELLPDWYDEWLVAWRERWRQVRLHALEALAGVLAAQGSFGLAVDAALAAVQAEPLRESAQRALIEVHRAEGNHLEALRQYDAFAALLHAELGLEPSPGLRTLVADLPRR